MTLTREAVRQAFQEASSAHDWLDIIEFQSMVALRDAINSKMLAAGLMHGTLHMKHPAEIKTVGRCCQLKCTSHYFEEREAVTLNPDGFVGFAGWADEEHVQPILLGFTEWISSHLLTQIKGE
jgi:hypothetical protein